jgi:uncharacterized protein YijF (DUF1287 family)
LAIGAGGVRQRLKAVVFFDGVGRDIGWCGTHAPQHAGKCSDAVFILGQRLAARELAVKPVSSHHLRRRDDEQNLVGHGSRVR